VHEDRGVFSIPNQGGRGRETRRWKKYLNGGKGKKKNLRRGTKRRTQKKAEHPEKKGYRRQVVGRGQKKMKYEKELVLFLKSYGKASSDRQGKSTIILR